MYRRLPPLNALKAFEAAGRNISFTRAADELGVSHGAVSRHIKALEEWLGVILFERHNRRVVLTEAGAAYLADIGASLDRIATATVRQVERGRARVLQINALATFTLRWLIPRLSGFQLAFPHIEVRLTTSNVPLARIEEPFDVAIRGGPETRPGHVARSFLPERRIPVCSPGVLDRAPLREAEDLAHHTLLHAATFPEVWPQWLQAAGVPRLKPQASVTLEHFYLTLQAAQDGLGIAMGPEQLIASDIAAGRLVLPFPKPFLQARSYHTYVPDSRIDDPAVRAFCDWLTTTAQ